MDDRADLSHLADIVAPPPVPWWPPAFGWWLVGAALLAVLTIFARQAYLRYRRNAYRRAAAVELSALGPVADGGSLIAISSILKRTALVSYPRQDVASLTGVDWLAFLDRAADTDDFTKGPAARIGQAALGARADGGEAIRAAARRWIARHKAEA